MIDRHGQQSTELLGFDKLRSHKKTKLGTEYKHLSVVNEGLVNRGVSWVWKRRFGTWSKHTCGAWGSSLTRALEQIGYLVVVGEVTF